MTHQNISMSASLFQRRAETKWRSFAILIQSWQNTIYSGYMSGRKIQQPWGPANLIFKRIGISHSCLLFFCGTSSLPKPVTLHEILTALLIRRLSLVIISFSLVLSVLYKATKTNTSIDVKLWLGSCNDVVKRCSYREEVKISGGATSPPRKIAKPQSWHQSHTQKHSGWSPR